MMSVIIENPSLNVWNDILERPTQKIENIEHTVLDIFIDIKRNGDKAIVKYSKIYLNIMFYKLFLSVRPSRVVRAGSSPSVPGGLVY